MTKKIVKRTDANNETLYFYTHSDAVDVGDGNATTSLTNALNNKASTSDVQTLSNDTLRKSPQSLSSQEKSQVHNNIGTESFVDDRAVRYDDAQVLGSEEKTQALTNLGLNGVDDEPTPNSDNLVKSGGVQNELALGAVYDVSAKNPTAGSNNDGKFESLSALLSDANINTLIPIAVRKGGMSIKFVQSSDNKYVQYRLMATAWSTTVTDWQGVDKELKAGSKNLVESGGVYIEIVYNRNIFRLTTLSFNGNTAVTIEGLVFIFPNGQTVDFSDADGTYNISPAMCYLVLDRNTGVISVITSNFNLKENYITLLFKRNGIVQSGVLYQRYIEQENKKLIEETNQRIEKIEYSEDVYVVPINWTQGGVFYAYGTQGSASTLRYSEYIDISGYENAKRIRYSRAKLTISTPYGLAFYNSSKTYISGRQLVENAPANGVEEDIVEIPEGTKYIRFTYFLSDSYGDFYLYIQKYVNKYAQDVNEKLNSLSEIVGEHDGGVPITEYLQVAEWYDDTYVYSSGSSIGNTNTSLSDGCATGFIDISAYQGKTLVYTQLLLTAPNIISGLCFYDTDKQAISGVNNIGGASSLDYQLNSITIPNNAAFARFSFHESLKSSFSAYVSYISISFSSGIGLDVQNLQDDVNTLIEDVAELKGDEDSDYTPAQCRNRFYTAMREWCELHGIEDVTIEGPAGYGAGGDVSPEVLTHGQAQMPIYGVAKLIAIASSYPEICKADNKSKYVIKTKGNEATITIQSTISASQNHTALTEHYNVLLYKSGGISGTAVNLSAICQSDDFNGKIVVGVIRTTQSTTETAGENRYLAFKYLMDIAKEKIANPQADVSSLITLLQTQKVQNAVAVALPYGNVELYHHIDFANSEYNIFSYNPAVINTASMIKLLTSIIMLDYIKDIDKYITIESADAQAASGGTAPTFSVGQMVTYRDLLYASLLPSSNLSSYAIARKVGQYLLDTYRGNGFLPEGS